jgi:hypothetical protein
MNAKEIVEELSLIDNKKKELEALFNKLTPLEFFIGGYRAAGGNDIAIEREDITHAKMLLKEFFQSLERAELALKADIPVPDENVAEKKEAKMEVKKSQTNKKK